jgi:hypothetical protein
MGNPAPIFAMRGVRFNAAKVFGKDQNHLRLEFDNGLEGIWWRGAKRFYQNLPGSAPGQAPDMVFRIGWNEFRKKASLEIMELGDSLAARENNVRRPRLF